MAANHQPEKVLLEANKNLEASTPELLRISVGKDLLIQVHLGRGKIPGVKNSLCV